MAELVRRGFNIGAVSARRLGLPLLRKAPRRRRAVLKPESLAEPLRRCFDELGGTFTKFGQLLASSPGLFGDVMADEFRSSLDTGPPVPFESVRRQVEGELGRDLFEAFSSFDPEPLGRASIAVVHRASLHDGTEVAVKVIRPGIEHLVATDLDLMVPCFELLAQVTGEQFAGSTLQVLDGFRVQIGEELDLQNEARALQWFGDELASIDAPDLVVPRPFPELSGSNVLTMELLRGVPVDDLVEARARGVDPAPLVRQVVRAFFVTTVRAGIFHGDLHAGNMLLLDDGRLGIVDWGIVGRLDEATHRFFVRLLEGVLGDEGAWEDITGYLEATYGPVLRQGLGLSGPDLAAFVRQVVEPTLTRPFGEVSLAALLEAPQRQAALAYGAEARQHPLRAQLRRWRAQRRLLRLAAESGYSSSSFDRGTFLLSKQLLYFERYGRLLMADVPLIDDPAFFAGVLAEAGRGPATGGRPIAEEN